MKTSIILSTFAGLFLLSSAADACSLRFPQPEEIKDLFVSAVAERTGANPDAIATHMTRPEVTLLNGIGADCSGIDSIFFSAGYSLKQYNPTSICQVRGVVILKGFTLDDEVLVQDSTTCVGYPVSRIRE